MKRFKRLSFSCSNGLFRRLCIIIVIFVMLCVVKRRNENEDSAILSRLVGPLAYDDPNLLLYVAQNLIHKPSTLPYRLMNTTGNTEVEIGEYNLYSSELGHDFIQRTIRKLFQGIKSGFFVEAGALDGEYLSTTLHLEIESGWTGLLVEANDRMFRNLLGKCRKAWAANVCLGLHSYPYNDYLSDLIKDTVDNIHFDRQTRARSTLHSIAGGLSYDRSDGGYLVYERVQCLSLATLLLAINVTQVDLVSLDVEGAEVGVLQHFPWDRISVDVWIVEHGRHESSESLEDQNSPSSIKSSLPSKNSQTLDATSNNSLDQNFINFFLSKNYDLYEASGGMSLTNYVFLKRNSKYQVMN